MRLLIVTFCRHDERHSQLYSKLGTYILTGPKPMNFINESKNVLSMNQKIG